MTQQLDAVTTTPEPALTATADATTLKVGIVGLGYVGLPTAIAFSAGGAHVVGVDVNAQRLNAIRALRVDLSPSDLSQLKQVFQGNALTLTDDLDLLATVDAIVVCVPTPVDDHLTPDLTVLAAACRGVVRVARPGQLIVLTSTSYVGTTDDLLVKPLTDRGLLVGVDVFVAFSPERIDPGNLAFTHDSVPRVVGGTTSECARRAADLLRQTTHQVHIVSSTKAAELTKLYENTFRAVNIALVNEIADVSNELSVQITEVIDAAATKPYGFMPFAPGPGVGGHCIPCDPHYLLWQLRRQRVAMPLVESAMRGIAERPARVVARVREELADHGIALRGAHVAIVGVAYKPGVEDVRESPALEIIKRLTDLGVEVSYVDPFVPVVDIDGQQLAAMTPPELLLRRSVDLAVLHTRHPQLTLDWLDSVPIVLDATYRAADLDHRVLV
jgi:nucleotide sugar dehydrogenase